MGHSSKVYSARREAMGANAECAGRDEIGLASADKQPLQEPLGNRLWLTKRKAR
jgi:hypothetical protein